MTPNRRLRAAFLLLEGRNAKKICGPSGEKGKK